MGLVPPLAPDRPVEISVPSGIRVRRSQVDLTRHRLPPHSHGIDGVRVLTVAETVLAAAPRLGLLDLVVVVDGVRGGRASDSASSGVTGLEM